MRCVRVIIADRHPIVVYGLMSLLSTKSDFRVVASCYDGKKCLQAIRDLSPDIALLDIWMPGLTGFDILAAVTIEHLPTRIVFLTASALYHQSRAQITCFPLAPRNPGSTSVLKDAAPAVLIDSLRQVAAGRRLLPLANGGAPLGQESPPTAPTTPENVLTVLTERERQIMQLVSEGLSNKEVGRQLSISNGTIKVHLHHIYQKLTIGNRTALAALAFSLHHVVVDDDVPSPLTA